MRTRKYVLDKSTGQTLSYDYYYSGGQLMALEISDGTKMTFMYDENGTPVAMKNYTSGSSSTYSLYYYIVNAQGDVVGMATKSGSIVAKYKYDAWGKLLSATTGSGAALSKTSAFYLQPLRYRGYVYDNESGLYYLQSRYYDPVVGRFINADNIIMQNLQGTNLFAYWYNNPVNRTDPTGHYSVLDVSKSPIEKYHSAMDSLASTPNALKQHRDPGPIDYASRHPSTNYIDNYKNSDGSYSLYDNRRTQTATNYHEKIFSVSTNRLSYSPGKGLTGSVKVSVISAGWEFEKVNLALFDFGKVNDSCNLSKNEIKVGAMASIWSPSVNIKAFDQNITISAHLGAIGGNLKFGKEGFGIEGAAAIGIGFSISPD